MLQVLLFLILVISLLGSFSIINSEAFFHMKTYEKKSKRHQPSLTPSSSKQESEDIVEVYLNNIICNIFIIYTLIYT